MELLAITLLGGVTIGIVYAIAGASQVVLYRASGIVSFAHGDIAAVALFMGLWMHGLGTPYIAVAVAVVTLGALLATVIGAVIIPFQRFGFLPAVMATVAVGLIIQGVENLVVGGRPRRFPSSGEQTLFTVGSVSVNAWTVVALTVCLITFGILGLVFSRTGTGIAMRAVHADPGAADILGIPKYRLRLMSWFISGALAGLAGLFIAPIFSLTPFSVNGLLIFAFCAIVVGGLESVLGALVAGILVGVAGNLVAAYVDTGLVNIAVYSVVLVVLLLRPQGIFGTQTAVRV